MDTADRSDSWAATLEDVAASDAADADALLAGLNDEQREAVTSEALPLAIHAGAGSGKTRVLTHRIAWRTLTGRSDPRRVLALTFTRKAASEMRRRLWRLGMRDQVAAGTFHSVAYAQLRNLWRENDQREPELLVRKMGLVAPLLPRDHRATAALDVVAEIEWAKARRIRPEAYPDAAEAAERNLPLPPPTVARIFREYEEVKAEKRMVDFDDLLDQCRRALATNKRFADAQRWRFRHLYVDEFQDVNPLQFQLLDAWLDGRPDLCVVGDPDQAIYGWNGADADHLRRFPVHFPGATVLNLRQNYRSTPQILRTAAAVLGGSDPMLANRDRGPDPVVERHPDHEAEALAVARRIRELRGPDGRWSDHAVLMRTNAQAESLVAALQAADIPVRTRAGSGLLDRADVKAQLTALGRSDRLLTDRIADLRAVGDGADDDGEDGGDTERRTAFAELRRLADEFQALDPSGTARGFVAWARSQARATSDESADAVEVSTFHAAKGLEWPTVHLTGLELGLVPIAHAQTTEARAEERRLLYVALTRAEDRLFCSWAAQRTFGTRTSARKPSFWLEDMEAAIAGLDRPVGRAEGMRRVAEIRQRTGRANLPDHPVVDALRQYRSTAAQAADVPAYVVFTDATLADLVSVWPTTTAELLGVSGIGPTKADRHGEALLAVLASHDRPDRTRSDEPTPPTVVAAPSFDPDTADRPEDPVCDALRTWRLETSRKAGVPAYRVLTNRALDALVELRPVDADGLLAVPGIGPRTVEAYGDAILVVLAATG